MIVKFMICVLNCEFFENFEKIFPTSKFGEVKKLFENKNKNILSFFFLKRLALSHEKRKKVMRKKKRRKKRRGKKGSLRKACG